MKHFDFIISDDEAKVLLDLVKIEMIKAEEMASQVIFYKSNKKNIEDDDTYQFYINKIKFFKNLLEKNNGSNMALEYLKSKAPNGKSIVENLFNSPDSSDFFKTPKVNNTEELKELYQITKLIPGIKIKGTIKGHDNKIIEFNEQSIMEDSDGRRYHA